MKKIHLITPSIFLITIILSVSEGFSQNVGIGTALPTGKLQVNHRSQPFNPSLVIFDSSTSSAGRIKFLNTGGNRFWQINTIVNNAIPSGHYLDIVTDSLWIMTMRGNGNIGINNSFPTYKLDVTGDGYFDGILRVNDRLGLGVTNPTEKLDVNGNINLNGVLKVNGSAGTAGQVFTSNGVGDPQWKNSALSNTTRFYLVGSEGADENSRINFTARYNTNTTDITVGTNSFTVNKAGLYHIEGSALIFGNWDPSTSYTPSFHLSYMDDGIATRIIYDEMKLDDGFGAYDRYRLFRNFSLEIFIMAGSSIQLYPDFIANSTNLISFDYIIELRGHLISE